MGASRANVASSFTIVKGAMIDETYAVFAAWDFERTKRENLTRLRDENFIGAATSTWLRDVSKVLSRRFDPQGRDRALVLLAKSGCDLEIWKPLLLWHMTRDEFLLRDFLVHCSLPTRAARTACGQRSSTTTVRSITKRGGTTEHEWSETTRDLGVTRRGRPQVRCASGGDFHGNSWPPLLTVSAGEASCAAVSSMRVTRPTSTTSKASAL